jgi:hypothetical protein
LSSLEKRQVGDFMTMVTLGKLLADEYDKTSHKARRKGEGDSFDEYIASLGISRATGWNAMRVYRKFWQFDTSGIKPVRLTQLLAVKMEAQEIPLWLEFARKSSVDEFRDAILQAKGKPPKNECKHKRTVKVCMDCNARLTKKGK